MLTCERNGCGPRIKGMRSLIWHANVLVTFWKKNERTANYIEKRRKVQVGNNKKQFRSGLGHASTQAGQYRHTSCACHWDTIFLSWPYANGCSGPQKRSRFCCNLPIRRISGVLVIFLSCVWSLNCRQIARDPWYPPDGRTQVPRDGYSLGLGRTQCLHGMNSACSSWGLLHISQYH